MYGLLMHFNRGERHTYFHLEHCFGKQLVEEAIKNKYIEKAADTDSSYYITQKGIEFRDK